MNTKNKFINRIGRRFPVDFNAGEKNQFLRASKKNKKHRRGILDRDTVVFGRLLQIDKLLFVYLH